MSRFRETPIWESEAPWSDQQIVESTFRNFEKTLNTINDLPGGKLHQELDDLQSSVKLYLNSVEEFRSSISVFKGNALRQGFWDRSNDPLREKLEASIQRGLFCSSMSALALVDHARRFSKNFSIEGYEERKESTFINNLEHQFIKHFRQYATHFRITKANWRIAQDSRGNRVNFLLCPKELKKWQKWSGCALKFIDANLDGIDVEALFNSYSTTVSGFYEWLGAAILDKYHDKLQLYYSTKRFYHSIQSRNSWRVLIEQVAKPQNLNPYNYLSRYLTKSQIEAVLALPYKSKLQVDKIIHFVDEYGACDEEMRQMVYKYFAAE